MKDEKPENKTIYYKITTRNNLCVSGWYPETDIEQARATKDRLNAELESKWHILIKVTEEIID